MNEKHENWTVITKYEALGKLPNPFLFDDGTPLKGSEDWPRRREEMYKTAVELQYGTMPPAPEFLKVEPLYMGVSHRYYRVTSGTAEHPVSFQMIVLPAKSKKAPAVISGDYCFGYAYNKEYVDAFLDNDINLVFFNRTELASDVAIYNLRRIEDETSGDYIAGRKILDGIEAGSCGGPLKEAYPECTFGTIGAWAWGYSRCVDALEYLGIVDTDLIAFTGHSRGGKTALLAGVLDERAAIVNPNGSGMGGCAGYRIKTAIRGEDGKVNTCETASIMCRAFPTWLGQGMKDYLGREQELPFDSHFLKAMVAPRIFFDSEAASDHWANPVGAWQTSVAAREVYRLLGCEENILWSFREGGHGQREEDVLRLINIINRERRGEALADNFFTVPFEPMPLEFDWKCPGQ